jgi:hypothetical protein
MDRNGVGVARTILAALSSAKLARSDECEKLMHELPKTVTNFHSIEELMRESRLLRVEANMLAEIAAGLVPNQM